MHEPKYRVLHVQNDNEQAKGRRTIEHKSLVRALQVQKDPTLPFPSSQQGTQCAIETNTIFAAVTPGERLFFIAREHPSIVPQTAGTNVPRRPESSPFLETKSVEGVSVALRHMKDGGSVANANTDIGLMK